MIGAFTAGKKAAQYGYKKYGVKGAVVAGAGGAVGMIAAKKALRSAARSTAEEVVEDETGDGPTDAADGTDE